MFECDIGIVARHLVHNPAPENAVLKHICLVDGGDLLAALAGGLEGDLRNAADFAFPINHGIHREILAVLALDVFGFAKIKTAGEFPHAEHIEAAFDQARVQRRGVGQLGQANGGTQIRKETEMFAQRQESGALGLFVGRKGFPLRPADGSEKNGIRRLTSGNRLRRQRAAGTIDSGSSDQLVIEIKLDGKFFRDRIKDAQSLGHDFGPDSVARQNGDAEGFFWIHGGRVYLLASPESSAATLGWLQAAFLREV